MENNIESPQKIKPTTTIQSRNSTPGIFSEENRNTNSKRCIPTVLTVTLFIIVKIWEQPNVHQQMNKSMWHIYTMDYYPAIRRMKSCHMQQQHVPKGYYAK